MRTGSLSSLSERDHGSIREFRAFAHAEAERQRRAEDLAEYKKYCQLVENEQERVPPAHRITPLGFEDWRMFAPQDQPDPTLRGSLTTNAALLSTTRADEAHAVKAGRPDPAFKIPESAKALRMPILQAKEFTRQQAEIFVANTPEYFPSRENFAAISKYLNENGLVIPNAECFRRAWLRLRELGMIQERPAPAQELPLQPEAEPTPEEIRQKRCDDYYNKVVVTDPVTRKSYTEAELDRLSADEYKKLMLGEFRTPTVRDIISPWSSKRNESIR